MKTITKQLQKALAASDSPLTFTIPKAEGRRFVISDIHGCSQTFRELVNQMQLTKKDQLFLLGDYIDRGVDSKGVLDHIEYLATTGLQVYPLRGNHEQMLLDASKHGSRILQHHAVQNRIRPLLNSKGEVEEKYRQFIEALPYYFELEDYYLVHAGFNFAAPNPFEDSEAMLWIRDFEVDRGWVGERVIVHGHTPQPDYVILDAIEQRQSKVPLDNGCVFSNADLKEPKGKLLGLNLDTLEVLSVRNLRDVVR